MKILICDDRNADDIVSAVKDTAGTDPLPLSDAALTAQLHSFFEHVHSKIFHQEASGSLGDFDSCDLIFLDYNLSHLDSKGAWRTADAIAGYLRAFSGSKCVVQLNRFELIDFDLSYLMGDVETKADYAVNTDHLREPGLWSPDRRGAGDAFLPWYWPALETAPDRRARQVEKVREALDAPILASLGFPPDAIDALSRDARSFLWPFSGDAAGPAKPVEEVTFWDFFRGASRLLQLDERFAFVTGEERKDIDQVEAFVKEHAPPADSSILDVVSRAVAADIDFWVRRHVLGPQNVLIDAPHLQSALRFRLGDKAKNPEEWSRTAVERTGTMGFDDETFARLKPFLNRDEIWLDRPTFWWPQLDLDNELGELRAAADLQLTTVFCEDTRRFVDRATLAKPVHRFVPRLVDQSSPRFVERIEGRAYSPGTLFAE